MLLNINYNQQVKDVQCATHYTIITHKDLAKCMLLLARIHVLEGGGTK